MVTPDAKREAVPHAASAGRARCRHCTRELFVAPAVVSNEP